MKYFDRMHPIAAFIYFLCLLLLCMLTLDPVLVLVTWVMSFAFFGMLRGWRKAFGGLLYSLPLWLLIALTNPLFVHRGQTVLFFLNDNPVTYEAICYGAVAAGVIMAVYGWCRCYSEVMTSDKFVYLFGRVIPRLSLVLSLILAFIPKLHRRYRRISEAQRALGIYATESYLDRLRSRLRVLSILLTASLEGAVETADSMRARGYGLKGRSSYAIYRMTPSDGAFLGFTVCSSLVCFLLLAFGVGHMDYYPVMTPLAFTPEKIVLYTLVLLLSGAAVFLEIKDALVWHSLRSKI